jgi:hypothetical protein
MTTATQSTMQQVLAALAVAQVRIKPAVIADTPANGLALSKYLHENNLAPTAENFYTAIKALVNVPGSLTWVVKPAKLVAMEQNERPAVSKSAQESEAEFGAKLRAGEAADAKAKADEASIKQAKDLISSYNPTTNTRSGPTYDARERIDRQAEWTAALNQAISQKSNLQEFAKTLAAAIQKRYADRERASERM